MRTGLYRLALLGLLGLAAAAPGDPAPAILLPGVGSQDRRVPINTDAMPWRAVGRVQTESGSRCTGFMIGPSTVLTAAHCLFNHRTDRFMRAATVHFVTGYAGGTYAGHAIATSLAIGPGYDPHHQQDSLGSDWAVITLSAPLGSPDRLLSLATVPVSSGQPVTLGGYGQDHAEIIIADLHCAVTSSVRDSAGRRLIEHGCAGTRGTSGAPLLTRGGAGGWLVVGIQIAALMGESAGIAVPVDGLNLGSAKPVGEPEQ